MSKIQSASALNANPDGTSLWRLPTVLANFPISRSGWYQGVKDGRFPAPVRLGPRSVAWRTSDIQSLIASL